MEVNDFLPQPNPSPKHPHPTPPLHFMDAPYTDWTSQRWTYFGENFSDWPSLPPFVDDIQQVCSGNLGTEQGVWFLTNSSLYFVLNLDGGDPGRVQFIDVGDELEVDVTSDSRVAVDTYDAVFLATPHNVTLLECSMDMK